MRNEERIEKILGECTERRDRGEVVDAEQLCREHTEVAEELRARLAAEALAAQVLAEGRSAERAPEEHFPEIENYRIVREVGRGGMGVVYEAEQVAMARRVALKVLTLGFSSAPQAVKRFQREAQAAGRLHHTNIVPIYDLGQHAGNWYYAMELVEGRSLTSVISDLRRQGRRPSEENLALLAGSRTPRAEPPATGTGDRAYFHRVAELFAGVAEGLEAAHQAGIIHRDVKPSNLLLDADGVLKIVDFGLARFDDETLSMTLTGDLLGTPLYMSPEQAMAKRIRLDHRTDIYSLGATLYEVLTLAPPFDAQSLQELCSQIITKDPALPRRRNAKVPRDLETIVLKAMEKDRDKRYASARSFAQDLRAFAAGATIRARRIGPAARAWRVVKRHKARAALAAAFAVAVTAGTWFGLRAAEEAAGRARMQYLQLCSEGWEAAVRWRGAVSSGQGEMQLDRPPDVAPMEYFTRAIGLLPDRPEAFAGRALVSTGTMEGRLADVSAARSRGLSERSWRLLRAMIFRHAGESRNSEEEIRLAGPPGAEAALDLLVMGRLHAARGEFAEAEEHLTRAASGQADADAICYLALHARGFLRVLRGNSDGALEDLLAVRAAGDRSLSTGAYIAALWRRLGLEAKAEEEVAALLDRLRREGAEEEWGALCGALWWADEKASADRTARAAVEAYPHSSRVAWECGWYRSDPNERLAEADRAVRLAPGVASAHEARAAALGALGRHEEAVAASDRALALDPVARLYVGHGYALCQLRRFQEALAAFDRAIEIEPNNAPAHHDRGLALHGLGRHEEALDSCDRALAIDPINAKRHSSRAIVLNSLGRHEEALKSNDRAIEIEPDNAAAHHNRGCTLDDLGRQEEALKSVDRALELDPNLAEAHNLRGVLLKALGRNEEALASYGRALEIDPNSARTHSNRAGLLIDLGRREEALQSADRAIEIDPNLASAHNSRGLALKALGRHAEALQSYDRALELDPNWANAHSNRGSLLHDVFRRFAEALEEFDRALALDPNLAEPHFNRGNALVSLGRHKEALASYDRALALGLAEAHCNRGQLLTLLGRPEEALASFDRWLEINPRRADNRAVSVHVVRGALLHNALHRDVEALDAFDRALALDPNCTMAHGNRSIVLSGLGRNAEAQAARERALALGDKDPSVLNGAAWYLATAADPSARDPGRAVDLAKRAVETEPGERAYWHTLGVALCSAGRWQEALRALDRSMQLRSGGDAWEWLFVARAKGQLGQKEDAQQWYGKAVAWIKEHAPEDPELERFRAETASLLGIPK